MRAKSRMIRRTVAGCPKVYSFLFFTFAVSVVFLVSTFSVSAKSMPDPFWNKTEETSAKRIDHGLWQRTLDEYLQVHGSGVNRFDYGALKKNAADGAKLAKYLDYLQHIDPREYSKAEQKAYWINFYNSLTVKLVVDAHPVDSILNICEDRASGSKCSGPWKEKHVKVAGRDLTLDNIENDILRPVWKDNLIHYGLSCASYGCPSLLKTAFTAENTDKLLAAAAREYVNHPRGVNFLEDDLLVISSIYDWYKEDFGKSEQDIMRHLQSYADKKLAKRLADFKGTIDYEYDWSLNCP